MSSIDVRMKTMETNIQEMHDLLLKAKGVRWLLAATLVFGGTIGTILAAAVGTVHFWRNG